MSTATGSRVQSIAKNNFPESVTRNGSPARLYHDALEFDKGTITSTGGIATLSGEKTGRSPKDKRVVDQAAIHDDVWWGEINIPFSESSFESLRAAAIKFLDDCPNLYVMDGFAGWDPDNRLKIRIICSRPYHALFMHNMLIRPVGDDLDTFGTPDYVIYNAGQMKADQSIEGVTSETCVALDFGSAEMVITGTEYAGEMKKGVFTIMNYLMPKKGVLSMHCSANQGPAKDVSLFFGLSGTGKTTLSADPNRGLIGDDEHCWSDSGIFNIEGGCYAKCIDLTAEKEPEIFNAIRFGSVLENTVQDSVTHEVDFTDDSITQNTRCSYPIEFIDNAKLPCIGGHPRNIILLTCDAFGVLPPVGKLTAHQAMYHFISGYTAKVAGTEMGVTEPEATFSACFGAAFLVLHPMRYAQQLAEKINQHGSHVWLVNTGWIGGGYDKGARISLKYTRAIIDAIHDGSLAGANFTADPVFGIAVPDACSGVPAEILTPRSSWTDPAEYDAAAKALATEFAANFKVFEDQATQEILNAAPKV